LQNKTGTAALAGIVYTGVTICGGLIWTVGWKLKNILNFLTKIVV